MRSVELTARGPFFPPASELRPAPKYCAAKAPSPQSGAARSSIPSDQIPVSEKLGAVLSRNEQPPSPIPPWDGISLPAPSEGGTPLTPVGRAGRGAVGSSWNEIQRPEFRPQDSAQSTRLWVSFLIRVSQARRNASCVEPNAVGYDRGRAVYVQRQVVAYQPVDTVVKKVEVPVRRRREVLVSKPVLKEKIVHVPKIIPKYIEKIVEIPQVEWVEKVVSVPNYVFRSKLVPKVVLKENIIEKPVYVDKWVEKIVEVPYVEEVVRYRTVHVPEEVIKHIPDGHEEAEWNGAPVFLVPPGVAPQLADQWVRPSEDSLRQTAPSDLPLLNRTEKREGAPPDAPSEN